MIPRKYRKARHVGALAIMILGLLAIGTRAKPQGGEVQQRLAELKAASAQNKENLATYTWQEQDTISVKGETKKQELFQVRVGPDGKPQKTAMNTSQPQEQPKQADTGRRGGRIKERVIENKKEEFKEYAQKIGALARSYAPPDPEKLQQAFKNGDVKLEHGSAPDQVQLFITNYVKPNDSMTITFNRAAKAIQGVQIASYMDSASDAVKIAVQFAKLPDGTNHISTMSVDGVSKQLNVLVENSNYKKL
jgi:hypothetical protein